MEAFNLIDADKGGEISLEEMREAMTSADVGISKTDMEYIFRKVGSRDNKLETMATSTIFENTQIKITIFIFPVYRLTGTGTGIYRLQNLVTSYDDSE